MDNFYSVARIRAIENYLLTSEQISRMAQANDFEAAFSVLSETIYGAHLQSLKQAFDFEELFQLERKQLQELLQKLAPEFEQFKNYSSPAKIDLTNIKTILRCQAIDKNPDHYLLAGGRIDLDTLKEIKSKSAAEIISRLSYTPYIPFIEEGINDLSKLDKLIDDYILAQLKKAKYLASGLEPVIGFYLAKENEINTIRFILICKKNFVPSDKIKERVRAIY